MKMKFARVISMILVFALFIGLTPADFSLSMTASALNDVQTDRLNEGKKNISEDVDFWNDINIDQSFAYQVRMATNYADRQYSVGNSIGAEDSNYGNNLNMSNIAPFFGYSVGEIENDELNSPENTRTGNSDTSASVMYSKEILRSTVCGTIDNGSNYNPPYMYYSYGLLLSMTGLDSVGSNAANQTRNLYGWIAQISYYAASFVNMIFEVCFDFLWTTNPFIFFKDINTSASGEAELDGIYNNATGGLSGDVDGSIGALASFFGRLYNMFTDFAWTVSIPLSLLFIVIAFFLTRRGRYTFGSNIKKFIVTVVFIAMGIPILGSAYTQVLDGLRNTQSSSDDFLAQAVSYTFVDFRRWAETSRLSPPSGLSIIVEPRTSSGGDVVGDNALVQGKTIQNLRRICSEINQQSGLFSFDGIKKTLTVSDTGILLKDYIYDTTSNAILAIDGNNPTEDYNNRQAVSDLLKDYRDGIKYSATMFESGAVAWMQKNTDSSVISYGDMLALSVDKYSFSQKAERQIHSLQGKVEYGDIKYDPDNPAEAGTYSAVASNRFAATDNFAGVEYNIWNNGTLTGAKMTYGGSGITDQGDKNAGITFSASKPGSSNGYDCEQRMGLSTMAMYTYLTSEFTQAGIITYGNSPTVYTHNFHYAVNLIGCNPIMQFAFLANLIAILLGYFILAVTFVFRTVFDILFKGFQLMGHALLAAVGFYKSIGTCICMVVNMIAQLFITVVFFSFMTDFMFMISSIFDNFFYTVFSNVTNMEYAYITFGFSATSSYASEIITMLASFLSAFVVVFFVSFATKWRALIMSSINGMVENVIGTLLGVNLSGTSDGVMGGMAKSALRDAANVAVGAAAVGGGVALVNGVQDMANDITASTESTEEVSAVDAAVAPSVGSGFDGGKGAVEGNQEDKEEGLDVLENGFEPKGGEKTKETDKEEAVETSESTSSDGQTESFGLTKTTVPQRNLGSNSGSASDDNILQRTNASSSGTAESKASNKIDSKSKDNTKSDAETTNPSAATFAEWKEANAGSETGTDVEAADASVQAEEADAVASGVSFDPTRGLVMTSVSEDGTVSDVAIGLNGLSLASTDENGNKTVSTINTNGMTTEYTGADGTSETTTATFDGVNSNVKVERTDADGNSEIITSGLGGSTVERMEKSEDGSVTTTTTNPDGTKTIEVENAETGYQSTIEYAVDGSSVQTENIGGVETVTATDANGTVTSKVSTSTGADGKTNVSSYKLNDDGSVTRAVQAGGVKTTTTENTDGSVNEVQSSVLSNGTIAETTTNYSADGKKVGDSSTVVRSADGRSIISRGLTSSGTDSVGSYTMTSVETSTGSVESKDYGNGHTITTETVSNGDMSVTEAHGNGSYTITETDASSGAVKTTQINHQFGGAVSGTSVTKDSNGNVLDQTNITSGSDGSLSYVNIAGGTFAVAETGEGSAKADTVTMTYASGGSNAVSVNRSTGDTVTTVEDGMGGTSTITVDSESGATEINSARADGTVIHSVTSGNGDYIETITQANGGVRNIVRTGSGDSAVEKIIYTDGVGNSSSVTTEGGSVTYRSGNTADGGSYVQEINSSGDWETTQTLASGDRIHTVVQSDGDFTRTVSYANGASRTEVLENDSLNVSTTSVSGIETNSVRTSSAESSFVKLDGISMAERTDSRTGTITRIVNIADQQYEVVTETDGSTKTSFQMPNNVRGSYKTNADGSQVNIIRQADNSSRVETITTSGESSVVYMDSTGNTITETNEVTRLNDSYARSISDFNVGLQTARENLSRININSIDNLSSFEVPSISANMTMPGITSFVRTSSGSNMTILPGTSDEEFNQRLFESSTGSSDINLDNILVGPPSPDTIRDGVGGEFGRFDTMFTGSASGTNGSNN